MNRVILAIDQGTTSCRAILYRLDFQILASHQLEFPQIYPKEGWVEHDAIEIWKTQLECCRQVINQAKISAHAIASIGITNQRETIVAWDRNTGIPIYHAIVWQDRRTADDCILDIEYLTIKLNQSKTGLNLDAYFSAPKIRWILQHVPEAKRLVAEHQLCIGTMDSWILWNLTKGAVFATDYSNASRTNLFHIEDLCWDSELLDYYQIPEEVLPKVVDSIGIIGFTSPTIFGETIPIAGIAGDQQAALYGHRCFEKGMIKNTFGTGCFLLQNIGNVFKLSQHKLLTTIGWKDGEELVYAIEGSVFNAGSALKWLKENLQLIENYKDIEEICASMPDTDGVYVVPAFTGLGAPYWDMYARGTIVGLTRNSNKSHIIRATIESLAYQTKDIVDTMILDSGIPFHELRVDGGVSESGFLLQFLSDILQIPIIRNESKECTALGVAMMAAKGVGLEETIRDIERSTTSHRYAPKMNATESQRHYARWKDAVTKSQHWAEKGEV